MSETTRRAVLAGAVGVTAVTVLAACGDDDSGSDSTGSGSTPGGPIAKKADIPVGGGKIVSDDGGTVITQPESGTFKAFTAICTHQQCIVTDVANNNINCKCHGSTFSATDGSVTNPPASQPLKEKTLRFEGDDIYVTS
ncbi:ubiquinol-cytochrome c reductase iron-sulfur subunit [Dactylosporangium sp. CS-033363]|uniref:QcrA and Rieske domain-containing protein n=1 Tax=Dactylosporangium sp. CS-033363 TaxID=3239935 RepID=UPI003D90D01D